MSSFEQFGLGLLLVAVGFIGYGLQLAALEWWDTAVKSRQEAWHQLYVRRVDGGPAARHHAPCWWWWVAQWHCPQRCREVPAPTDPDRILMRQVALIGRTLYLQQFCSSEEAEWMHSHQWRWTIALGLHGGYVERRLAGWGRIASNAPAQRLVAREAPYLYAMSSHVVHHVQHPEPGHTSLFLGLWRNDNLKHYYPTACAHRWEDHIQKRVARI